MPNEHLEALQGFDPAVLTNVVSQIQQSPAFEVHDWTVQPISHEKIIDTTGGLFLFQGSGQDSRGVRPWTVVLKVVNQSGHEAYQNPRYWAYWKREPLAFGSSINLGSCSAFQPRVWLSSCKRCSVTSPAGGITRPLRKPVPHARSALSLQ